MNPMIWICQWSIGQGNAQTCHDIEAAAEAAAHAVVTSRTAGVATWFRCEVEG